MTQLFSKTVLINLCASYAGCSLESDRFNRAKWPRFERRTGQLLLDLIRPVVLIRCADFAGAMTPKPEFAELLAHRRCFKIIGEIVAWKSNRFSFFLARAIRARSPKKYGPTTSRDREGIWKRATGNILGIRRIRGSRTNDRYLHSSGTGCVIALAARKLR